MDIPYSTNEVRVGTWIDGKPLYAILAKVMNTNPTTRAYFQSFSDYGAQNVNFAFVEVGFTRYPSYNVFYTLQEAQCHVQLQMNSQQIVFINNNTEGREQDIYALIKYTKSTD